MSLFTELFQPGMLIILGIIIITFSIIVIYIQYIVQEQNHKLKQMVSLISSLAEELNNIKYDSHIIQNHNTHKDNFQQNTNDLISVSTEDHETSTEDQETSTENDQLSIEEDELYTENDELSIEEDELSIEEDELELSREEEGSFTEDIGNEFILENNNDIDIEYSFHPEDKIIDFMNPMNHINPINPMNTNIIPSTETSYTNMNLTELRKLVVSKKLCLMNHAKKLKKEQLIELLEK